MARRSTGGSTYGVLGWRRGEPTPLLGCWSGEIPRIIFDSSAPENLGADDSMSSEFAAFIDAEPIRVGRLPLFHLTDGHTFRQILGSDTLEPRPCSVYGEDLLYFFYGRPSYRVNSDVGAAKLLSCLPVCFILAGDDVEDCRRMMPFDSGAFSAGLFSPAVFARIHRDDFQLTPRMESAQRLVSKFYESNGDYFWGRPKPAVSIPALQFEAEAYQELVQSRAAATFDDRCSALEVQLHESYPLADGTVLAVIAPEPLLIEPVVKEAIGVRWRAQGIPYDFTRMKAVEYTSVIFHLAVRLLEDGGYL